MEIIFNKANNLYLELPHKIYYTIKSTRTKKTIWIFWGYTRSSLMFKVQISFICILQSAVGQVVLTKCKAQSMLQTENCKANFSLSHHGH